MAKVDKPTIPEMVEMIDGLTNHFAGSLEKLTKVADNIDPGAVCELTRDECRSIRLALMLISQHQ